MDGFQYLARTAYAILSQGLLFALRTSSRQPISSGATCSAGRAKKAWGRCWEGVVAMGVALGSL